MAKEKKQKKINPIITTKQWKKRLDNGLLDNMSSKQLVAIETAPNGNKAYIFNSKNESTIYKAISKEIGGEYLLPLITAICSVEKGKFSYRLEVDK